MDDRERAKVAMFGLFCFVCGLVCGAAYVMVHLGDK